MTKNDLTVFTYNETPVRTIEMENQVWWVLADVCKVLEIKNSRDAAKRLDEDEKNTVALSDGIPGNPNRTIINEPGLYSLILRSDKPEAKQFKRWVTHEVLPAIRKSGSYGQGYDKMEIARMITECKSAAGVKAIMTLFDVTPSFSVPFHTPANTNNSVTLFLNDSYSEDLAKVSQKEVYSNYKTFCSARDLVPSTLANFSKEIHKQTGFTVKRHRVNGRLTGFYTK